MYADLNVSVIYYLLQYYVFRWLKTLTSLLQKNQNEILQEWDDFYQLSTNLFHFIFIEQKVYVQVSLPWSCLFDFLAIVFSILSTIRMLLCSCKNYLYESHVKQKKQNYLTLLQSLSCKSTLTPQYLLLS